LGDQFNTFSHHVLVSLPNFVMVWQGILLLFIK